MFRTHQIITATQLIRHFRELAKHLSDSGEPLLVLRKEGGSLVVLDAAVFEELVLERYGPEPGAAQESLPKYDISQHYPE